MSYMCQEKMKSVSFTKVMEIDGIVASDARLLSG
jgi:hypothetical protein